MKNSLYILQRYWRKHIKNAAALMFSGILTVAVVFGALMQFRGIFNRELHKDYDWFGMFDLMLPEAKEGTIEKLIDENETPVYGYIYVLGKIGKTGIDSESYTYGYIDDPHGLMHIPIEAGVLPSNEGEIAIDRGVLNKWNWAGTLGDSITLEGKSYSVVGIIDECYGQNRNFSEVGGAGNPDVAKYYIPLIYTAPPDDDTPIVYTTTLVGGVVANQEEEERYGEEILYPEYGDGKYGYVSKFDDGIVRSIKVKDEFIYDIRWVLILSGIAALIAVLSVFSVLRGIFIQRRDFINTLHRIGMSKKKIRGLYGLECTIFILVQIIIGTALGTLGYAAINAYSINVLGESGHSAFTTDILVTSNTLDPFAVAAIFGVVITAAAYILTAVTTAYKPRERVKQRKPRSLRASLAAVFRERGVTAIQIVSLSLIGFGVMLGYLYYTRDGKEWHDYLKYDFPISYYVGKEDFFNMEEDGIAEYYSCGFPSSTIITNSGGTKEEFYLTENNFKLGLDDDTADQFTNVTAAGELMQTFVISDVKNTKYPDKVFFDEQWTEYIAQVSDNEYKDFFKEGSLGSKHLYRLGTKLANRAVIEMLSEYVVDGEINISALNSGSEVVIVSNSANSPYSVGEKLHIGSAAGNDMGGIADIAEAEVTVGAVAVIPNDADKTLVYAAKSKNGLNMLTTASGAKANGLHNAAYMELFAKEDIDGGVIPASCGAKLTSYKELKHRELLENAVEYGGLAILFTVMSLLGFSAYFSGIGIKIRQKSYEISALRAVGTPLKRIRSKLFADGLKIPLVAAVISGLGIFIFQKISENAYERLIILWDIWNNEQSEAMNDQISELIDTYFLNELMWTVPIIKPLLIILAVMCGATVILTLIALKKFKRNIAGELGEGRTKQ